MTPAERTERRIGPAQFLEPPGRKDARPGDRDDAEAALRAARRMQKNTPWRAISGIPARAWMAGTSQDKPGQDERYWNQRRSSCPALCRASTGYRSNARRCRIHDFFRSLLDEIGTDFAVIYPTAGLGLPRSKDDETRRVVIHANNIVSVDYFRDFSDRMTPAAIIPMHTPEEAIADLEFVTGKHGAKVGMFGSNLPRPVPSAATEDAEPRLVLKYG
jgi:hypothetical protein